MRSLTRLLALLTLLTLALGAHAQTYPTPTYTWVKLNPQGGTPGGAANGVCWTQTDGLHCFYNGSAHGPWIVSGGAIPLTVGTTTIASGTSGRVLYDNGGLLGEYTAAQLTAQINAFSSSLSGAAPSSGGGTANFLRADGTWATPPGTATGTVTTSGSPASGNLTKFSGATAITNGDLSGDATTSGSLALTLATVNANTGTWGDGTHVGAFTVNGKGLITAASNVAITGAAPSGAAGGDLSSTYPNPTVAAINGATLGTTTATSGNVLIGSGTAWVTHAFSGDFTIGNTGVATLATVNTNTGSWGDGTHVGTFTVNGKGLITAASSTAITGAAPTGSAGGDLSGTYPNPAVAQINGVALGSTTATSGNLLIGSGTAWVTHAMSGDAALSSTGALTLGTVNSDTGSFGDGTHVPAITVNGKGLITAVTSTAISGAAPTGSAGGDLSGTYPNPTVAKVNAVTYPSGPSANTVPVVTSATSGGTVTYEAVPNAALANSSMTIAGHSVALGGSQTIACGDLSNGATGCSTATGTSGGTIPLLNGTNTWSGAQSFNSSDLKLNGSVSGAITLNAASAAGTNTLTLPAGTTDFSATGGTSQVVKQTASGGAFTVAQLACSDLSNGATGCSTATGTSGATIPLLNGANTWSGVQSVNSGDLALKGASSGTITLNAAAAAGSSTITLPGGTTDFSGTGGTSQVVKQTSSGGAFTVAQLACGDLSNSGTGCTTTVGTSATVNTGTSGATIPLLNAANTWSNSQAGSITTLAISTATFTPDATNNHYKITLVHASCPCTVANPSPSFVAGTTGVIEVQQSATGSDTIGTWGSSYEAPSGTSSIVLSTAASAIDILAYYVIDATHILLIPSLNFSH